MDKTHVLYAALWCTTNLWAVLLQIVTVYNVSYKLLYRIVRHGYTVRTDSVYKTAISVIGAELRICKRCGSIFLKLVNFRQCLWKMRGPKSCIYLHEIKSFTKSRLVGKWRHNRKKNRTPNKLVLSENSWTFRLPHDSVVHWAEKQKNLQLKSASIIASGILRMLAGDCHRFD